MWLAWKGQMMWWLYLMQMKFFFMQELGVLDHKFSCFLVVGIVILIAIVLINNVHKQKDSLNGRCWVLISHDGVLNIFIVSVQKAVNKIYIQWHWHHVAMAMHSWWHPWGQCSLCYENSIWGIQIWHGPWSLQWAIPWWGLCTIVCWQTNKRERKTKRLALFLVPWQMEYRPYFGIPASHERMLHNAETDLADIGWGGSWKVQPPGLAARNLERGMSLVPKEKEKAGSVQRFMFFLSLIKRE